MAQGIITFHETIDIFIQHKYFRIKVVQLIVRTIENMDKEPSFEIFN